MAHLCNNTTSQWVFLDRPVALAVHMRYSMYTRRPENVHWASLCGLLRVYISGPGQAGGGLLAGQCALHTNMNKNIWGTFGGLLGWGESVGVGVDGGFGSQTAAAPSCVERTAFFGGFTHCSCTAPPWCFQAIDAGFGSQIAAVPCSIQSSSKKHKSIYKYGQGLVFCLRFSQNFA